MNKQIYHKELEFYPKAWKVGEFKTKHDERYDVVEKKNKPIDYNESGCFRLALATVASCFANNKDYEEKEAAKAFALDGKLIKMLCDCSDNFESTKLRKLIIKKNSK